MGLKVQTTEACKNSVDYDEIVLFLLAFSAMTVSMFMTMMPMAVVSMVMTVPMMLMRMFLPSLVSNNMQCPLRRQMTPTTGLTFLVLNLDKSVLIDSSESIQIIFVLTLHLY